jgi:hypothetical protein
MNEPTIADYAMREHTFARESADAIYFYAEESAGFG